MAGPSHSYSRSQSLSSMASDFKENYLHRSPSNKPFLQKTRSESHSSTSSSNPPHSTESSRSMNDGSSHETVSGRDNGSYASGSGSSTSPTQGVADYVGHAHVVRRATPWPGRGPGGLGDDALNTSRDAQGRNPGKSKDPFRAHATFLEKFNTGLSRSDSERSIRGSHTGRIEQLRANPVVSFTIPEQEPLPPRPNTNVTTKKHAVQDSNLSVNHITQSAPTDECGGASEALRQIKRLNTSLSAASPTAIRRLSEAFASLMSDMTSQHRDTFPLIMHNEHSFVHAQTFPGSPGSPSLITVRKASESYFAISQLLRRKNTGRPDDLPRNMQRAAPMDRPSSDLLGFETLPADKASNNKQKGLSDEQATRQNTIRLVHERIESISRMSESRRQSLVAEPTVTVIDVVRTPEHSPMDDESRRRSSISMASPRRMSTVQIKSRKSVYEVIWRENETPSRPGTPVHGEQPFEKAIREESEEDELAFNNNSKVNVEKSNLTAAMDSEAVMPQFSQPTWNTRPVPKQLRIVTGNEVATRPEFCDSPTAVTPGPDSSPAINNNGGSDAKVDALTDPRKPVEIMVIGQGNDNSEGGALQGTVIKLQADGHGPDKKGSWMSVKERKALGGWDGDGDSPLA